MSRRPRPSSSFAKLPKSYTCGECKKKQKFIQYVYANWDSVITATCDCGAKSRLFHGKAVLLDPL